MTRAAGITLLELLVVVAIISILAVTASLSIGRQPGLARSGGDESVLMRAHRTAWQDAVLGQRDIALVITPTQLARQRRVGDTWEADGEVYRLRGELLVSPGAGTERADALDGWRLVTLASGRGSAADIRIVSRDRERTCRTDGSEPLTCGPSE